MLRPACAVVLFLTLLAATVPCRAERGEPPCRFPHSETARHHEERPLQQLLLALTTRPGITYGSHSKTLLPAIHAGAEAFSDALGHDRRLHRFSRNLKPLLAAYNTDMARAAEGLAGAEARGTAMDRLLSGIIEVARKAKIHPEEVDMALLQAAAAVENSLERPPLAKALSLEDRKLISLLLLNSIHQVSRRAVVMTEPFDAMATLGTDPSLITYYAQRIGFVWYGPALAGELVALEKTLSAPNLLADPNNLIMMQFNTEASNDLFYLKVALELCIPDSHLDLTLLASKMASMGGIMANMTPALLQESGAVPLNSRYLAAFSWVDPSSPLVYSPDPTLADKLLALGDEVPPPPDFSFFSSPYRDIFQLRYDLSLCDRIMSREWRDAEDRAYVLKQRPLSMTERLALRKADADRRQAVMGRLADATPQQKHALRILLSAFFGK
ncbi:MAG: hypothetical protein ED859_02510 [Desulfuromonadales bacterium]|nr:MAG: hypothetical protein ED859_02510 [Desulfuromonadales bacterium]